MNSTPMTQASFDFGHTLYEILHHLEGHRGFLRPIQLAAIGSASMTLQTILPDGDGVRLHYPVGVGEFLLGLPADLLLVDCGGKSIKVAITDTGEWLLG